MLAVAAYTTADPVREDALGLALPFGRYAIQLAEGCDGVTAGQNVAFRSEADLDWIEPACHIYVIGMMSDVPCFTNELGECDVAQEFD